MTLTTKIAAGLGAAALSLMAASGIASAAPGDEAIVNSTCSYPQVMAALRVQSPAAADEVAGNQLANAWLQQLVASPPAQRQQMVDQARTFPQVQQNVGLISQVASTCNNF
ncbi:MAG: hemophore-related protein [Mycobacterium sp.]